MRAMDTVTQQLVAQLMPMVLQARKCCTAPTQKIDCEYRGEPFSRKSIECEEKYW